MGGPFFQQLNDIYNARNWLIPAAGMAYNAMPDLGFGVAPNFGGGGPGKGTPSKYGFGARRPVAPRLGVKIRGNSGSVVAGKRKKKKKASKPLKRIRRIIAKSIKTSKVVKEVKLNDIDYQFMEQIACTLNHVAWKDMTDNWDLVAWRNMCNYEAIRNTADGVTIADTVNPTSTVATLNNLTFKIKVLYQIYGKNNTNSPCEITTYLMKCAENTDLEPYEDLEERYERQLKITNPSNPGAALAAPIDITENFGQYWTTPTMKDAKWGIKVKKTIYLQPGDEFKFNLGHTFKVRNMNEGIQIFEKGCPRILMRLQGVPSHDATTSTLNCMSPSQVDLLVRPNYKAYKAESAMTGQQHMQIARLGFAGTSAVLAEDENVAPYEAA